MKKRFSLSLLALLLAGNVTSIVCANHVVLYDYRSSFSTELVSDDYIVNVDHRDRVEARKTDVYKKTFASGVEVVIAVRGDGDTDLDLFVYDENGNLIEKDDDATDRCIVSFTPKWTGSFTIKIKNLGNVYNSYRIKILQ